MRFFTFALIVLLLVPAAGEGIAQQTRPVDEASRNGSLERVRDRLRQAFQARDVDAAKRDIHPLIENRVTGDVGRDQFIAWLQAEPARWDRVHELLGRGGKMVNEDNFVAPSSASIDLLDRNRLTAGIVTGTAVRVRSRPSTNADVVEKLTYAIVRVPRWDVDFDGNTAPDGWLRVVTPGGKTGYMSARYVAPVATYSLRFAQIRGVWWLKTVDTNFR